MLRNNNDKSYPKAEKGERAMDVKNGEIGRGCEKSFSIFY